MAVSKRRYAFWRNLPHFQGRGKALFVGLSTYGRWEMPPAARDVVFQTCLREHKARVHMYAFVVIPEHVHLLFVPLWDANGEKFGLAEIMSGIKGPSAHGVNKLLKRRGHVWEEEYFDHVLRKSETIEGKMKYIWENPMLAGLVTNPADYPWLWINEE